MSRELVTRAFELAGKAPRMSSISRLIMRAGGIFVPGARETVAMMYEFERPFVVDHGKFKRSFGDTPVDEALAQTLRWYRQGR